MHLETWKFQNCEEKTAEDPESVIHNIDAKLSTILNRLTKLEELTARVSKIEDSLEDAKQNIDFINEKYHEIIGTGGCVANKELEHLANQNKELVAQVAELQWKHNQREQDELGNQLVIGVQEVEKEDIKNLALKVCSLLKESDASPDIIKEEGIVEVTRMKTKSNYSQNKLSPIHVTLKNKVLADKIIQAKKDFAPIIVPGDLKLKPGKQIYINYMLTKENKDLLMHTRNTLKNKEGFNFKFVWHSKVKILARKDRDTPVIRCKNKPSCTRSDQIIMMTI
jgi:hypothetical protein